MQAACAPLCSRLADPGHRVGVRGATDVSFSGACAGCEARENAPLRQFSTAFLRDTGIEIAVEGNPKLFNPDEILTVNPARYEGIQFDAAEKLTDWITSVPGQRAIAAFQVDGQQVFFPAAKTGN